MTRSRFAGGGIAALLLLAALALGVRACRSAAPPEAAGASDPSPAPVSTPPAPPGAPEPAPGVLYGRVTTEKGAVLEGRLRWGEEGDQEAFWSDLFNGVEPDNPWAVHVPPGRLPVERSRVWFLGMEIGERERPLDLARYYVARFGDLVRIEAEGREVRVTAKSGTTAVLDRWNASDFDDGVRVWDAARGTVGLASGEIRSIDFLPTPPLADPPARLHGTVRADGRELRGFLLWDRWASVATDELVGRADGEWHRLPFGEVRAIAPEPDDRARVTLADGRELVLSETREIGPDNRGIVVEDPRFGPVVVTWSALERIELDPPGAAGSGPGYDDFAAGRPLAGSVVLGDGRRLAGRIVFDLDESETIEMLDAPSGRLRHSIPFGLLAAIERLGPGGDGDRPAFRVTLRGGEVLELGAESDLASTNAGVLVFAEPVDAAATVPAGRAEYVAWEEVARIDFEVPSP